MLERPVRMLCVIVKLDIRKMLENGPAIVHEQLLPWEIGGTVEPDAWDAILFARAGHKQCDLMHKQFVEQEPVQEKKLCARNPGPLWRIQTFAVQPDQTVAGLVQAARRTTFGAILANVIT